MSYVDLDGLKGEMGRRSGGGGAIPKDFGRNKPMNPTPTADDIKKDLERKQAPGQDLADALKCSFMVWVNCDAEKEIKKALRCILAECTTTCPPSTFYIDYNSGPSVAFDPKTTTCTCKVYGFNPDYKGGPPPGLTPPGR